MTDTPRGLSRRLLLAASAVGAAATASALVATPALAAPNYSVIPRLPGEVSRLDTNFSRDGKKPYEVIDVKIGNDLTQLFVPHSAKPGSGSPVPVAWFYHASGSAYTALYNAYNYSADPLVDLGFVSICPNFGGPSNYTNPTALAVQTAATAWVQSLWNVRGSFLRSNSGGGAMMCWAYAKKMVPNIYGAYHASSVFDVEDLAARDDSQPNRVLAVYGGDRALMRATNPARLPQSAWQGMRLRVSAGTADQLAPAELHGGRLRRLALPVAKEATIAYHSSDGFKGGHTVPPFTNKDSVETFRRWLQEGPA
ncbi:hypothetical protein C5D34_08675 [Rathayibacter sp. AY1B1]|uniref:alpha/beta hydrolase family protein n=1 Tax=unclassified Rathayibacter TaxID=2609250 RepID=UPI000CE82BEA|nr:MULTISPECIES: hypothetical protein [unclassified Rathayibacter]PPI23916.1 hypothetical protein C5D08_03620 [Rathayibacter sp. AY1B6]PPI34792.1 hypothetical protein C5D34_08675 [Rathayibacter sp. AY1B1]